MDQSLKFDTKSRRAFLMRQRLEGKTLKEISIMLEVSECRASQIETQALKELWAEIRRYLLDKGNE